MIHHLKNLCPIRFSSFKKNLNSGCNVMHSRRYLRLFPEPVRKPRTLNLISGTTDERID